MNLKKKNSISTQHSKIYESCTPFFFTKFSKLNYNSYYQHIQRISSLLMRI